MADSVLCNIRILVDRDGDGQMAMAHKTANWPILVGEEEKILAEVQQAIDSVSNDGGVRCVYEVNIADDSGVFENVAPPDFFKVDPFTLASIYEKTTDLLSELNDEAHKEDPNIPNVPQGFPED